MYIIDISIRNLKQNKNIVQERLNSLVPGIGYETELWIKFPLISSSAKFGLKKVPPICSKMEPLKKFYLFFPELMYDYKKVPLICSEI